jgi:hypothetical protein
MVRMVLLEYKALFPEFLFCRPMKLRENEFSNRKAIFPNGSMSSVGGRKNKLQ